MRARRNQVARNLNVKKKKKDKIKLKMKSEANISSTIVVRTVHLSLVLLSTLLSLFQSTRGVSDHMLLQQEQQVSSSLGTKGLSVVPFPFNHRAGWTIPSLTQYSCVRLSPKFINRHTVLLNVVQVQRLVPADARRNWDQKHVLITLKKHESGLYCWWLPF